MAQLLYWLDRGGFAEALHQTWIWAMLVGTAGIANILGIAAIRRHYDRR
jgi:hypothetical protein